MFGRPWTRAMGASAQLVQLHSRKSDTMTTSAARQGYNATDGGTYWAVFQRIPNFPCVSGSHYGTRVDCTTECNGLHGHVYSSEEAARARLAILPTHYKSGREIVWDIGRVRYFQGGSFYDVLSLDIAELRPCMRLNVGTVSGGDYWQTVATVEQRGRVGGMQRGADVYAVTWHGAELEAAPSLLSSRQRYDVMRTEY